MSAVLQVAALAFVFSCQDASQRTRSSASWMSVGRAADVTVDPVKHAATRSELAFDPKARVAAIEMRQNSRTTESAIALARAYFPEFATSTAVSEPPRDPVQRARDESHALTVTTVGDRGMELTIRGLRFRVESRSGPREGHFFAPTQRLHGSDAAVWKTSRVEEYWVRDTAAGMHHAEYEVALPKEITRLHDAGDYLELLNAAGVPMLRFHPSVVRDAEGRTRQGTVELADAKQVGDHLYAIEDRLQLATSVSLEGLTPPLVVDPGWSSAASMATARWLHTTTLLTSGKVLVVGGSTISGAQTSAELYDPATNSWSAAGNLATGRYAHTATVLPSGKVLVAGGQGNGSNSGLNTAQLYDPATNTWSVAASFTTKRYGHTATLLPSGKVLVAGGAGDTDSTRTAEMYDPATNQWGAMGTFASSHAGHTATVLASGKVLLIGGYGGGGTAAADVFDPVAYNWNPAASMPTARGEHSATLLPSGKVLVAGGYGGGALATALLYDPVANTWSAAGTLSVARFAFAAALLPSGKVVVAGGESNTGNALGTVDLYDPGTNTWSPGSSLNQPRFYHSGTLLPSGKLLVASGMGNNSAPIVQTELYDTATNVWSAGGSLASTRDSHTATLLPSGKVLVAGGWGAVSSTLDTAELYDSATNTWSAAASLATARQLHTATLLPSGKVLVAGGTGGAGLVAPAEQYDPGTNTWTAAGSLIAPRFAHEATTLPSGKVLVTGGFDGNSLATAELYDPATNTWSAAASLTLKRNGHSATLLPSGKVLVAGGYNGSTYVSASELYDPATNTWSAAGSLAVARGAHTATLLPTGKVLVTGGSAGVFISLFTAELYDPATNTWSAAGSLTDDRQFHTATLLPSGRVLVTGGLQSGNVRLASAELYDPLTNTWSAAGNLAAARQYQTATLLPPGKLLVAGGSGNSAPLSTVDLYDESGASDAWRPVVTTPASVSAIIPVAVTGTRFRGISGGSTGATNDSAADFPVVRLWSLANEQTWTLTATAFSATSVTATPPDVVRGYYLLTVTVNGITAGTVVSLVPNDPPVLSATPPDVTVEAAGPYGAVVAWLVPTATDDRDGTVAVKCLPAAGSTFAIGTTDVTCTAKDSGGKTASTTFKVTVRDTTAPQVDCPSDLTLEATSSVGAPGTFSATASDVVSGVLTPSYAPASGSTFPLGTTPVTASATDGANNTGTCSFSVKVQDTTAPVVSCPASITVEAVASTGASASWATITATDAVSSSPNVTTSRTSGSVFGLGDTTVDVSATDAASNKATCSFAVKVQDTTAPHLECPTNVVAEAAGPTGALVSFDAPVSSDLVSSATVTISQASMTQFPLGDTQVDVTSTDAASNKATCSFAVKVQDTTAPQVACPMNVVAEATGPTGALVTFDAPAASDLVSTPTVTTSQPSMSQFPLGDTQVDVTATDGASNKATCSFAVKVQDTTPPMLVVPADGVVEATSAEGAVVSFPSAMATDLVTASPTIVFEPASGTQLPLGQTTVTVTATDAAGNTATKTFRADVVDTTAPQIQCPANVEVTAENDAGATVTLPAPTVSDAVTAEPVVTFNQATAGVYPVGTTKVIATAKDADDNTATCEFTVTVKVKETPPSQVVKSGCGCSSDSPASTVAGLVVLGLALVRRRVRGAASM